MAYFADDLSLNDIKVDTDLAEKEYKNAIYDYTETLKDIYNEQEIKNIIQNIISSGLYLYKYVDDEIIDYKDEIIAKELNLKFQNALYAYKKNKDIYNKYLFDKSTINEEEISNTITNMNESKKEVDMYWEEIKKFSNLSDE